MVTVASPIRAACFGAHLGVDMHLVTADTGPLRNLEQCVNAAHLEVQGYVPAAHAAGLAVLVDDEMELGTVCIDIGAGTTSIGVFYDGEFVHADCGAAWRPSHHDGSGARPFNARGGGRTPEDPARVGFAKPRRRSRHPHRAAGQTMMAMKAGSLFRAGR